MNLFFKINGTVITPELNGSILNGITRKSVIDILKSKHIAPVSILYDRNPLINCLAYGSEKPVSQEESKKT